MLLSDCRSKIWLSLLCAVITWPVNLSLSGRWKWRGGRRELILLLYFIFSLSVLGAKPKALETIFIMWPSTGKDYVSGPSIWCNFNYSARHSAASFFFFIIHLISPLFPCLPSSCFNLHRLNFSFFFSTIYSLPPSSPSPPFLTLFSPPTLPSSTSEQTSTVKRGTTDNVSHAVCDWQLSKMAVAAHRGMENPFSGCTRVGPCAHLSAENRSMDYQSQLTPSQPREGLVGRGKAQSNTNKHEDQQMALCQSLPHSFLFFFYLTTPLSVVHLHLLTHILSWQSNVLFYFLYLYF